MRLAPSLERLRALPSRSDQSGQGLVEYALIIAIVSLGAVLALGFLSGKINTLFSKAGSSVDTVAVGAPGGGGSPPPPPGPPPPPPPATPPADLTSVSGTNIPSGSVWFNTGTIIDGPSTALLGRQGVYSTSQPSVGSCSFTLNGFSYTGVWVPSSNDNGLRWDNGPNDYEYACLEAPIPWTPPADNTELAATAATAAVNFAGSILTGSQGFWYSSGVLTAQSGAPNPNPAGVFDQGAGDAGTNYYFTSGGLFTCTWATLASPANWDYLGGSSENYDNYCT
jgi:Flp pilus assembly pilin Flp